MNPFFKTHFKDQNKPEYNLYNNATKEICEIWGREFYYIPKTLIKPDHIFGEDVLTEFNSAIQLTMLIENYEGFDGEGYVFEKFGIKIDQKIKLIIQQEYCDKTLGFVPQVNDLIYYPVADMIFKITWIDMLKQHFQLVGKNMSYRFVCQLYKPSHETLNTGINSVDAVGQLTDSNTQDEINEMTSKANEIIDFDSDFFNNI